ncbi:rh5-interacting protein-like isoform X2 [Battus philenor]|uniref:rh5-interacting protein-like isoform X2 n=1 Tax=Battus philenor TaxID=42288 RepID=UPI0035CF7981
MKQCPELANSPDNHDSTCGENEIMNNCPSPACEYCPSSDKEARACLTTSQKVCPPPKCTCRNNYRRLHNGTCVPTRECPSFKCPRVNEEFDPCPLCSNDNCSRATPDGTCKVIGRIGIPLQCRPSCRCKKNYWRDGDRCVPYESCPNVPKKCTKPHESLKCTTSCPRPRTCFGRHIRYKCPDVTAQVCKDECVCDDGYYRNSDGFCVTSDLCDKKCTGPNEVYKADKKTCPPETCRSIVARYKCDSNEVGQPGCVCKPGFLRLSLNSTCIPMEECPELKNSPDYNKPECKLPHESLKCVKVCPPPKTCNNRFVEVSCLYIANETCTHKCVCDDGFYRNEDGQCVTGDQCSDNCSKPNESIQCVKSCPRPRTCVGRHIRYRCLNNTDEVCQNKCLCNNGFYRNSDGFCVTSDLCDKKCGPNEEYKADKKSCPSDLCSSLGKQYKCDSKERGQPGCVCKEGFRRMNSMSPCIPEVECPEYTNLFPPGKCSDSDEVSESTNSKTPFIFDIEYWYILDVVPEKEMDSDEDFTRK